MPTYLTSDGTRLNKTTIDNRTRKAKEEKLSLMLDEFGFIFCEDCGRNASGTRLDCSHEISVDKAQKSGRSELAFAVSNIKIRCRSCHKKHDGVKINPNN